MQYNVVEIEKSFAPDFSAVAEVTVVRRNDIPSIHSVTINDITHNLGILKDFKRNQNIAEFIPELATLSLSWVRLQKDEILDPHQHPIKSMVIVTEGEVQLIGDKNAILRAGDLVVIPKGLKHGFIGSGENGFWGLSLQFEERGLYEKIDNPLVEFTGDPKNNLDTLIETNKSYLEEFDRNPLFELMRSGQLYDKQLRTKFFDCFQVFSNYFQKMMMNRVCFTEEGSYLSLFELHLEEEFGHNTKLSEDRNKRKPTWDPMLEATSGWFSNKMLSYDNIEKIILVHLVVEASACIFYKNAASIMDVDKFKSKHFEMHFSDIDTFHVTMGVDLLKKEGVLDFSKLLVVQAQGWEMLNSVFTRIAQLVLTK